MFYVPHKLTSDVTFK